MKIAFVGCGYVFDIYMRARWGHPELEVCGVFDIDAGRLATVSRRFGLIPYPSVDAMLADPAVDIVVNLTNIASHFEVVKRALEAGKHVYSEKPMTMDLEQTRALFALAEARGLVLTGAPCNLYSDAVSTLWKAVREGAIGKPVLIYAELDDNPAHLMNLEQVRSPTGAPFPYVEELSSGCTVEHAGYHLVWLCAMFGPALAVTAFSNILVEHKTDTPLSPPDTPDMSVACILFAGGVSARLTCTWVAPRDHSLRVIGEAGEIRIDNIFHDQSPITLERFTRVSLAARKPYTLRRQPGLGRLFGVGGRRMALVRRWKSHAVEAERGAGRSLKHQLVSWLRRREVYAQDKLLGIAEMARAMQEGRRQPMPPDFLMHINELALMIQGAGPHGATRTPTTTFDGVQPVAILGDGPDLAEYLRPTLFERLLKGVVQAAHG